MAAYRLARPRASSNLDIQTHTTIRSWRALAFAGVILAGTCYVLFQDLIEGAPLTVGHVLTALALLIATGAGHQIVPTFKAGRYPLTLSMIILAVGAITYIGIMSGARNAESISTKAERIEGSNAERVRITKLREQAQAMLNTALKEVAKACTGGVGKNCKGATATRDVYEAAVKGHNAALAKLGAVQTANAGYKSAAEAIVMLPWFSDRSATDVERALIVLLPWLAVLLAELSVPAFLSLALGHEHLPPTIADNSPPDNGGKRSLDLSSCTVAFVQSSFNTVDEPFSVLQPHPREGFIRTLAALRAGNLQLLDQCGGALTVSTELRERARIIKLVNRTLDHRGLGRLQLGARLHQPTIDIFHQRYSGVVFFGTCDGQRSADPCHRSFLLNVGWV